MLAGIMSHALDYYRGQLTACSEFVVKTPLAPKSISSVLIEPNRLLKNSVYHLYRYLT